MAVLIDVLRDQLEDILAGVLDGRPLFYFNFNGVNQVGQCPRLIPDPPNDDFGVKFTLYNPIATFNGIIVAQNITTAVSSTEFRLQYSVGASLRTRIGGAETILGYTITEAGTYDFKFTGSTFEILKDGVQVATGGLNRGITAESAATFVVAARHGGSNSSYGFYYQGGISNVEVYPIAPTVFDAANYPMDEKSPFKRDINGGADMEIINWTESDEIPRS